jgi:thiaminase
LIGYGLIGRRLHSDPNTVREGNKYWKWISTYDGDHYWEAVKIGSGTFAFAQTNAGTDIDFPDLIETHAAKQSVSRIDELARIFIHATNVSTAELPGIFVKSEALANTSHKYRWSEGSGTWV